MASTYSSRLRVELIGSGEKDGTWGTTLNSQLGTILEEAIAGVASVTHDDSAAYTLTTNDGATDEARQMVLEIGGTLTADRQVVVPTQEKLYVVKNSTSGGFAVTVKTSGGSGVAVPNGKASLVYCDGTNVVDAITNLASLTLSAPLGVASGGTGSDTASDARTALGLAIGTDVQAYDADLAAIAGLTSAADRMVYYTGSAAAALATLTSFGRSLIDDADASAARSTLGLVIGTNVQAYNALLASLAGLSIVSGDIIYGSGTGTLARLAKGTNDQVLTLVAGLPAWAAAAGGTALIGVQVFTSSGTYTPTSAGAPILVFCTGGGGGGGGTPNGTNFPGSGGGGSGATAVEFISSAASTSVTIGAGGAAGNNGNGGAGGASSFGAYMTAGGGSGGEYASSTSSINMQGGAGGTVSVGGTFDIPGTGGVHGINPDGGGEGTGGSGGPSFWGGGGLGGLAGAVGDGTHGGGGGGASGGPLDDGGAGGAGIVVVFEFAG